MSACATCLATLTADTRAADDFQAIGFGVNNRLNWNGTVERREAAAVPDRQGKQVDVGNLPMTDDGFRPENGAIDQR